MMALRLKYSGQFLHLLTKRLIVLYATLNRMNITYRTDQVVPRKWVDLPFILLDKRYRYPCNRQWRPIGLWDVEADIFSRPSAHRWRWGCQPYAPAALYPTGRFLVLISVRGWVDSRTIVRLEGWGTLKKCTSSGFEPATFRLVV
jgi:hypothetical protein